MTVLRSMTCGRCRFYAPEDGKAYGDCTSPKIYKGYGEGARLRFEADPEGILVEDDEGWSILVGKDFGCINFKDRETMAEADLRARGLS